MPETIVALLAQLIADARAANPGRSVLIGVGGAQGAGKSYQCRKFAEANPKVAHFSLDDVYLTGAQRAQRARDWHPLFATRGPPGTHDLDLAETTITTLAQAEPATRTPLPRFDKAGDEPAAASDWPAFAGRPEAILIDGWCLGGAPEEDARHAAPLNPLETADDINGVWRGLVSAQLATSYRAFFARFDAIVYLQAPSFDIVETWRGQQEEEMLGRRMTMQEAATLNRFIMHYERITRAMLAGHHTARWIVHLDNARRVVRIEDCGRP